VGKRKQRSLRARQLRWQQEKQSSPLKSAGQAQLEQWQQVVEQAKQLEQQDS